MQEGYRTVLVDPPTNDNPARNPPHNHPMFYYQQRNDYLTQLSDRYATQQRLPTMDLKRNAKVGYYLSQYNNIHDQMKKKQAIQKAYLKSDQFETIFSEAIDQRREEKREERERERLKKDLENMWIEEQNSHLPPQKDIEYEDELNSQQQVHRTVLRDYRSDPLKQKQLYLLDLEIGQLKFEQSLDKKVQDKLHSCQNQKLLSKMSNNILSAYMVHFDEIYSQLIDEILQEEVYYLNYIEAQYKVGKNEQQPPEKTSSHLQYQNAKTLAMMDLVRGLDQLCDE